MMFKKMMIGAIAVTLSAVVAQAATVTATYKSVSPRIATHIHHAGGNSYVYAGQFNWVATGGTYEHLDGDFIAYCIEVAQHSGNTTFNVDPVADAPKPGGANIGPMGTTDAMYIGKLWSQFADAVVSNTTAAAFQLAIWEIVHETTGTLDLNSGDFYSYNNGANARTQANSWLDTIVDDTQNLIEVAPLIALTSLTKQDMVTIDPDPVPLVGTGVPVPAAAWMGGAMLGVIGTVRRYRRRNADLD